MKTDKLESEEIELDEKQNDDTDTVKSTDNSDTGLKALFNGVAEAKEKVGNMYDKAGVSLAMLGSSAMNGAIGGGVVMMLLSRGNFRASMYTALACAVYCVGRQLLKNSDSEGPPPPGPK